jgi:hypothetical protein
MTADMETPPYASQTFAWQALGSEFVGLLVQIFVSAVCYSSAIHLWSNKPGSLSRNTKIVLGVALVLNTVSFISSVANVLLWGTTQTRDEDTLVSCTIPDACMEQIGSRSVQI